MSKEKQIDTPTYTNLHQPCKLVQVGDCKNCNSHDEKQIEEIAQILASDCGKCSECNHFHKEVNGIDSCYFKYAEMIYAADFRKQSEGEWIKPTMYSEHICSHCGKSPKIFFGLLSPYCPNCGAKMKGGVG